MSSPKLSMSGFPTIPMNEVMSYEDWLKGRRARRLNGMRTSPEIIRRKEGPDDERLRQLYNGERGLPFPKAEDLRTELTPAEKALLSKV